MCGRVNVSDNEGVRVLLSMLGIDYTPTREPRFNIAPTQVLDVVQQHGGELQVAPMSWGVSLQMKGKQGQPITRRIPNSRSDKVFESRLWKPMISEQRVLIPVNGFYEWKRISEKPVQAYYISPSSSPAMFFGGIYRRASAELERDEVAIVTTEANRAMQKVHDRMPVILGSANEALAWLEDDSRESLEPLMRPADEGFLDFRKVGNYVNKSSNEGARCTAAAETDET